MRYPFIASLMLLVGSSFITVMAHEHRQHGVHEHGGGQLNLAVEEGTLMIDLSLPAMNIVGFEHPASNDHERDQLRSAVEKLRDGNTLFAANPEAMCHLTEVGIESVLLEEGSHHEEAHDEGGHEHADFDIDYEFTCREPDQLTVLTVSLFTQFPGTKHLEVQAITAYGQFGGGLMAGNNTLRLK